MDPQSANIGLKIVLPAGSIAIAASGGPAVLVGLGVVIVAAGVGAALVHRRDRAGPPVPVRRAD